MAKPAKRPKLEFKPEYSASVWKMQTEVEVVLAPWPSPQGETSERFSLSLHYENRQAEISWSVTRQKATREELVAFLEEWVPKAPDSELMNEGLAKLSAEVSDGVL